MSLAMECIRRKMAEEARLFEEVHLASGDGVERRPVHPLEKHEYVTLGSSKNGYYIPREFAEYLLGNKLVPEDWQIQEKS